ncbi:MAG TPA: YfhO family protein [Longimicrobiales bacterium]
MKTKTTIGHRASGARTASSQLQISIGISAGIYFGLALLFFLPAFLPGRHVFGTDYLIGSYPFHVFISERFAEGALPKWVPHVYGGLPLFSNPGTTFYPFRFLADLLLPVSLLFPAIYVIQFGLAGLGMNLLARELGVRSWIAFLAGLVYQFTGLTMSYVYAGHDGRIIVATLAPLFLFFLHRGIRTGHLAPFVGAAATIAFSLLSFQIQSNYYLLLAGLAWGIFALVHFRLIRQPAALARRVAMGVGAVAFGFAVASVNFLPFQGYVAESPRAGERGYEYATSWSMPPAEITGLAVPEHAGILQYYHGENPIKLHTEYVGALVLALFLLGLVYSRKNRYWWFFLVLGIITLTISFGGHTPIYRLYYELLPGTKKFRAPSISLFLLSLSLVAMAALTLERLAALRQERAEGARTAGHRASTAPDPLSPASWLLGGFVLASVLVIGIASASSAPAPELKAHFIGGATRFAIFAVMTAGVLWLWLRDRVPTLAAAGLLTLVSLADLWVIDQKFFETVESPEVMFAPDDVVQFLQAQPQPARTWVLPFPPGAVYRGTPGNYLMLFDLEQAGGEHGNMLRTYAEYVGAGTRTYIDWHNFLQDPRFLHAANIRYIVSGVPLDAPFFKEVHRGSAFVYENTNALPRAYLVPEAIPTDKPDGALEIMRGDAFDPSRMAVVNGRVEPLPDTPLEGSAEIVEHTPDRVVVRTRANRPALLVLADNYYEGWKATVDGQEVPVLRTNHTFRGVVVGEGEHTIRFEFQPSSLYTGLRIYLAGLALLAGYTVFWLVRGRRTPREEATAA